MIFSLFGMRSKWKKNVQIPGYGGFSSIERSAKRGITLLHIYAMFPLVKGTKFSSVHRKIKKLKKKKPRLEYLFRTHINFHHISFLFKKNRLMFYYVRNIINIEVILRETIITKLHFLFNFIFSISPSY